MILEKNMLLPTSRFSNRADNYLQYRPAYPGQVLSFMEQVLALKPHHKVADIGSGTGHFAELFLRKGYTVIGVEPNEAMRKASAKLLSHYSSFISVDAVAEDTGLDHRSIDLITVAQAFHWMEPGAAKQEFSRILHPGGHIAIISTTRRTHTAFLSGYDLLKQEFRFEPKPLLPDEERVRAFFGGTPVPCRIFRHRHHLDFEGLKGLLLSSSAIPLPGHPSYDNMISRLVQLFVAYNRNGFVEMEYETALYWNGL